MDIEGRKGDKLLYVAGTKLVAMTGNRSAGRIQWEWTGPASLSMPAIPEWTASGQGRHELRAEVRDQTGQSLCENVFEFEVSD
ncbi:MAG: hypothetical protein ABSF95_19970 [Verrucomicrobiota bacterium]